MSLTELRERASGKKVERVEALEEIRNETMSISAGELRELVETHSSHPLCCSEKGGLGIAARKNINAPDDYPLVCERADVQAVLAGCCVEWESRVENGIRIKCKKVGKKLSEDKPKTPKEDPKPKT